MHGEHTNMVIPHQSVGVLLDRIMNATRRPLAAVCNVMQLKTLFGVYSHKSFLWLLLLL